MGPRVMWTQIPGSTSDAEEVEVNGGRMKKGNNRLKEDSESGRNLEQTTVGNYVRHRGGDDPCEAGKTTDNPGTQRDKDWALKWLLYD